MSCFWGHSWGRWKLYQQVYGVVGSTANCVNVRQRRECEACGLVDDNFVTSGPDGLQQIAKAALPLKEISK